MWNGTFGVGELQHFKYRSDFCVVALLELGDFDLHYDTLEQRLNVSFELRYCLSEVNASS